MQTELKPCPFCGGEAAHGTIKYSEGDRNAKLNDQYKYYFINCIKCGATTQGIMGSKTPELAAQKWNGRVLDAD